MADRPSERDGPELADEVTRAHGTLTSTIKSA
jgi:hypothetical protein